ncbi:hypothetical protein SAMN05877753_104454 [Bacillus oleivorans]|uniref:DUF3048 family protein n=1 Tax=Bacillus oleivorans TaxID=1448271 RepID=A0A285CTV7_9BACI|nr:DUF3048 domain-containing protein [Bacillus oleivorans]SNX70962.1 hypothetical protein SAMN05877753_104454 [Bacillus oleivorans]
MLWKRKAASIVLGVGLLLAGCSEEEATPEEESSPPEQQEEDTTDENNKEYAFRYPLTGVGSDDEIKGRSVAVMINNDIHARPQTGLPEADIVYEILTEGNITRFLAIFQSNPPEEVGPVRSARDYFMDIAKGFNSLYIAHGFSTEAKVLSDNGYVDNINGMYYDGTLFYRSSERQAPHNSYTTFENIEKGAEKLRFDMGELPPSLSFMTDSDVEEIIGETAENVMVTYNSPLYDVIYEYDPESEKYKRFTNGEQTVDHQSGEPVLLDNIVILEAPHQVVDNKGRRDIDFSTGGEAYLVQKGKWKKIEWKNVDGRILPYENGQPAKLVTGKTWINVIPDNPGLTQSVSFEAITS